MPHFREPYRRELRRFDLAVRMIRLQARTRTICAWTGLSKPRIQSVSRAVRAQAGEKAGRPHGPSPTALRPLWESRRLRREAAAIAGLCSLFGVVAARGAAGEDGWLPGVQRGERLCLAYETYLTFVPSPKLSLEHAVLLAAALAGGVEVALESCPGCGCALLVERLDPSRRCGYCPG